MSWPYCRSVGAVLIAAVIAFSGRPLAAQTPPPVAETAAKAEAAGKTAETAGQLKEAFESYVRAVQALPDPPPLDRDVSLRERLIALAGRLLPHPPTPEAADRFAVRGKVLFDEAKEPAGFDDAATELRKAVREAPWVADFAYNLALVQEKQEYYRAAAANLKLYVSTGGPDVTAVRTKMYELELRREKSADAVKLREDCLFGSVAVCGRASLAYGEGRGVAANGARARELARAGCRADDALSCRMVIFTAIDATLKEVPESTRHAAVVLAAACQSGNAEACDGLAHAYDWGRGVPADVARYVQLTKQSCDGGFWEACTDLGFSYEKGRGVPASLALALALYRRSCDMGEGGGCIQLALAYENGKGVPKKLADAMRFYERGCDLGTTMSCHMGRDRSSSDFYGFPKDPAKATRFNRRACELGDTPSCK